MGNAGCGHTNRARLRVSLLPDRLSQPTADMVEALLFLQGHTLQLQDLAAYSAKPEAAMSPRPWMLVAAAYCILFGYCIEDDPQASRDYLAIFFSGILKRPQEPLKQMLSLRAQSVPLEKVMRIGPLVQDADMCPEVCKKVDCFGEVLQHLALYIRALAECAEIYIEIQEAVAMGLLDKTQGAALVDGTESDQRRAMVSALGGVEGTDAETGSGELPRTSSVAPQ